MEEGEGNSKFSQTNPHNDCSHLAAHTEKKNKQNFQNKHSSVNLYLLFTIYDIIFWTCITSEEKRLQISDYETSPENTANQVKGTEDALVQGLWHGGNGKGSPQVKRQQEGISKTLVQADHAHILLLLFFTGFVVKNYGCTLFCTNCHARQLKMYFCSIITH